MLVFGGTLGRVAISTSGAPEVFPVNYCLADDEIVVLTGPGTKLEAALLTSPVTFEVDHFDATYHTGWSVVVSGTARVVTDTTELARAHRLPVSRWAPRGGGEVVAIATDVISGRRIPLGVAHDA